jgi:hypothetical protein
MYKHELLEIRSEIQKKIKGKNNSLLSGWVRAHTEPGANR